MIGNYYLNRKIHKKIDEGENKYGPSPKNLDIKYVKAFLIKTFEKVKQLMSTFH